LALIYQALLVELRLRPRRWDTAVSDS